MEFVMQSDLNLLCRICMEDTSTVAAEDIFESSDADQPNLHSMLSVICAPVFVVTDVQELKVKESYGMPKTVCPDCVQKVVAAYELHEACIETDRKLWDMVMAKQQQEQEVEMVIVKSEPQVEEEKLDTDISDTNFQDDDSLSIPTQRCRKVRRTLDKPDEALEIGKKKKRKKPDNADRKCEICSKVLGSAGRLKQHMKESHPSMIINCNQCEDVFFNEAQNEDHQLFHLTGMPFACHLCKKRFKSRTGLRSHVQSHTSSPLQCTQCDRSYTSRKSLALHTQRHTGERPYACEQCPSRFHQKGSLQSHMLTHTKVRNFVCDICGSRFTKADSLVKHNRIHTGERPHECDQCDKKFRIINHLKRHKRTHTGEKPYKCAYCERAFSQSNDLVKHSRTHVGENPYKCDYCESSFRLLTELRNHFKVHFQPGDDGAKRVVIESQCPKEDAETDELPFTSASALNRRYKLEKKREQQQENGDAK